MAYGMKYTNGKKADTAAFPFKKDDKVYVSNENKEGDLVSEDEFESKFSQEGKDGKNYPQYSVQDYSSVKTDDKGKYVEKLKPGESAVNYGSPNNYAFGNYSKVADTQLGCDDCDNGRQPCNCK